MAPSASPTNPSWSGRVQDPVRDRPLEEGSRAAGSPGGGTWPLKRHRPQRSARRLAAHEPRRPGNGTRSSGTVGLCRSALARQMSGLRRGDNRAADPVAERVGVQVRVHGRPFGMVRARRVFRRGDVAAEGRPKRSARRLARSRARRRKTKRTRSSGTVGLCRFRSRSADERPAAAATTLRSQAHCATASLTFSPLVYRAANRPPANRPRRRISPLVYRAANRLRQRIASRGLPSGAPASRADPDAG